MYMVVGRVQAQGRPGRLFFGARDGNVFLQHDHALGLVNYLGLVVRLLFEEKEAPFRLFLGVVCSRG